MKYIIGLGNPGEKYHFTRHNVAWLIFDALDIDGWKHDKYMQAEYLGDEIKSEIVLYIKPQTFMNKSGEVIAHIKKQGQDDFSSEDIILVYDDIDLAFGTIRVSVNRGDGGHNGVKSITEHLGTKKTIRIRVGVSYITEEGKISKPNVLSNFSQEERDSVSNDISIRVEKIIESLVESGVEKTMNIFNAL